jgi:hypothetical protein
MAELMPSARPDPHAPDLPIGTPLAFACHTAAVDAEMGSEDRPAPQVETKARWNTDAQMPSGPGSDAGVAAAYGVVNWFVKKWRAMRDR